MDAILNRAKAAADLHIVKNVIVPCNSGSTARAALDVFRDGYRVFAVGNPTTSHEKGYVVHSGVADTTRTELEAAGVTVVLCEQSIFQHIGIGNRELDIAGQSFDFGKTWRGLRDLPHVLSTYKSHDFYNPLVLLLGFCDWLGPGFQVGLETMLIAADSGQLPLTEPVVTVVHPAEARPDVFIVMKPTTTEQLFKVEILDIGMVKR